MSSGTPGDVLLGLALREALNVLPPGVAPEVRGLIETATRAGVALLLGLFTPDAVEQAVRDGASARATIDWGKAGR